MSIETYKFYIIASKDRKQFVYTYETDSFETTGDIKAAHRWTYSAMARNAINNLEEALITQWGTKAAFYITSLVILELEATITEVIEEGF